jgi:hypothetical protein
MSSVATLSNRARWRNMTMRELQLADIEAGVRKWQRHLRQAQIYDNLLTQSQLTNSPLPQGVSKPKFKLATCEERLAKWVAKRLTLTT